MLQQKPNYDNETYPPLFKKKHAVKMDVPNKYIGVQQHYQQNERLKHFLKEISRKLSKC